MNEPLEIKRNQLKKPIDEHGYPIPKKEKCFKCGNDFWLNFCFSRQNYCQKNSWFYWTSKGEDKDKYICSPCLRNIYLKEKRFYRENVKDIKKKRMLSAYVSSKSI